MEPKRKDQVKSKKVYLLQLGGLLALLSLAGCMTAVKEQDSSVIRARALDRWNLLIEHKAEKAWDYLSPGYRETKPREAYAKEMNARGVNWSKVNFVSQQCDADACKVHLAVDYTLNLGGPVGRVASMGPIVETWIRVKGQWYYLPEQFRPTGLKEPGKES
jgi:hypothetical protein